MSEDVKVPCMVFSRVVGYIRPVSWWNTGKKREFEDRKVYAWAKAQQPGPQQKKTWAEHKMRRLGATQP